MHIERYSTGARAFLGLHGWGSNRNVFAPLAAHVPTNVSFYSADLPGCGPSRQPREWSIEAIVAEVVETIRSLGAGRVTVVGHCGGAVFGLIAARNAVELIERVVAIDPFAYLPRYFRLFNGEGFGRRAYEATFANPVGRWVTAKALNAGRDERTNLTASFSSADHEVARRYLHLFAELNGVEEVRGLRTTVDLVYGERTFGAVKKSVALLRDALPHASAFRLEGARHMPLTEATAQLARIVFTPTQVSEESRAKTGERVRNAEGGMKV